MSQRVETKNGRVVESRFEEDEPAFARLKELFLSGEIRGDFALDLIVKSPRHCTPEQRKWAHVLVYDAEFRQESESRPGLLAIRAFDAAHTHGGLRTPKATFAARDGEPGWALVRTSGGYEPGSIFIRTNPSGGGERIALGRICRDGLVQFRTEASPEMRRRILEFCAAPGIVARIEGQRTGRCCFCRLELTDPRSVSAGYGSICAENYALPWGAIEGSPEQGGMQL